MGHTHGGRIVIAGGSGFLGVSLAQFLQERGHEILIISRHPPKISGRWRYESWDGRQVGKWKQLLEGTAGLVNLAGRSVDCVKTPAQREEILRSRVDTTLALGKAMRGLERPPQVWVQMSTAHIYGDPPSNICDEETETGKGFAPMVGREWEKTFAESVLPAQRGVVLRTSFVIGRNRGVGNGALKKLGLIARLGLGGRIGSGKQGISWIHERDMNRLFERGLLDEGMSGTYVASAPNPVSQTEFMRGLRKAVGMPVGLPAAGWMVRLGARHLLKSDPELALLGRYVVSKRLKEEGFTFDFEHVEDALREVYG